VSTILQNHLPNCLVINIGDGVNQDDQLDVKQDDQLDVKPKAIVLKWNDDKIFNLPAYVTTLSLVGVVTNSTSRYIMAQCKNVTSFGLSGPLLHLATLFQDLNLIEFCQPITTLSLTKVCWPCFGNSTHQPNILTQILQTPMPNLLNFTFETMTLTPNYEYFVFNFINNCKNLTCLDISLKLPYNYTGHHQWSETHCQQDVFVNPPQLTTLKMHTSDSKLLANWTPFLVSQIKLQHFSLICDHHKYWRYECGQGTPVWVLLTNNTSTLEYLHLCLYPSENLSDIPMTSMVNLRTLNLCAYSKRTDDYGKINMLALPPNLQSLGLRNIISSYEQEM
jgi:hypothetical protein